MPPLETPEDSSSEPPSSPNPAPQSAWPWMLCVVGLDYMSTLGYVPSIAFDSTGRLAPLVMTALAFLTIFGALPIYWYIAGRSPNGQGVLAMIEKLIPGWLGKLLILIILGFAATDLIFTRTFSSADAAEHLLHGPNPSWQRTMDDLGQWIENHRHDLPSYIVQPLGGYSAKQLIVTLLLLSIGTIVGVIFRHGFRRRFVHIAVVTTVLYLALNVFVIGNGLLFLLDHPQLIHQWWQGIQSGDWQAKAITLNGPVDYGAIGVASMELVPRVALGLSGFEIAMLLMPLIKGKSTDTPENPKGRIRNTRKMLFCAALTMPIYLAGATFVTTLLIPPEAFRIDGQASNRAIAYLAHGGAITGMPGETIIHPIFGMLFGTIYDISTIAILCLAGVSIALCLADLLPPYLHRLGMELDWMHKLGLLIYLLVFLKIGVTIYYGANVDAQRSAYTTAVLAIFTAASYSACLDVWKRRKERSFLGRIPVLFGPIFLVFLVSTIHAITIDASGVFLTLWFIGFILISSMLTRFYRAAELRCDGFEFANEQSKEDFEKLKTLDFPILVPHRPGQRSLVEREIGIRKIHRIPGEMPVVFLVANLGDTSEFYMKPKIEIRHEQGRIVMYVSRCASIPQVIASIALEMSRIGTPPEIHFGWSEENPLTANLHFVLFGHGNVPWIVHTLLQRSNLPEKKRPRVLVG